MTSLNSGKPGPTKAVLLEAFSSFKLAFAGIGFVSAIVNLLALTGSIFMLQVYDRVIPSRSEPTLVGLSGLVLFLYGFQAVLEIVRSRLLVRVGFALDTRLSSSVFAAFAQAPLRATKAADGLQPLRDLDQVRSFLSGMGPIALFDLPWMPFYIAICFLFHFLIGAAALAGAIVLCSLTVLTEFRTRAPSRVVSALAADRNALAEAARRNAEVLQAMGFGTRVTERWSRTNVDYLAAQARSSDVTGSLGVVSKILRMTLQSCILATGAYLVIRQEATGGVMIASSIMTSRALAPIDVAIGQWKNFVSARQGWVRLKALLATVPLSKASVQLPPPARSLRLESVSAIPPRARKPVVRDVAFSLHAGDGLGIIGPSASGKSSLARVLTGIWTPTAGSVRLDGATLDQWATEELGKYVGYMPQDVQLFDGTIAENIARFEPDASSSAIINAALAAGIHDMIVRLPEGYDTRIGEAGSALSAGQRQRLALARALYRDPFFVVLDEPNSNLDAEGEIALTAAIQSVRQRNGIAVVIAHRPSALASLNKVAVMADGTLQAFGPKAEIMNRLTKPSQGTVGLKVVAGADESVP